jgi:predicted dithiol-disulfide oxidoreductase (DUF899 family)
MPMARIEKEYEFDAPAGKVTLLDLCEGRRQLIVYHFMFAPGVDGWTTAGCPGCSMVADQIIPLEHLHARDIVRADLPRPAAESSRLQAANGLGFAVVLL